MCVCVYMSWYCLLVLFIVLTFREYVKRAQKLAKQITTDIVTVKGDRDRWEGRNCTVPVILLLTFLVKR